MIILLLLNTYIPGGGGWGGVDTTGTAIWRNDCREFFYTYISSTIKTKGMGTINTAGTLGSTQTWGKGGIVFDYTTSAVSGGFAGVYSGETVLRTGWDNPVIYFRMHTSTIVSGARFWIAMGENAPNGTSNPVSQKVIGFRYATDVDATAYWRTYTSNGTASTVTTTSVAVSTGTNYDFRMNCFADSVQFYINEVWVATHTTNLPTATTMLNFYIFVTTLEAVIKGIYIARGSFMW